MSQIVFLAPHASMYAAAQAVIKGKHDDIHMEQGLLSKGVEKVSSLIKEGTEIIITRGGTALAIKESLLPVTIVEVPITGFDIIRTVERAKAYGQRIGAVSFPSILTGIDCLNQILNVDIRLYPINNEAEADRELLNARKNGADVIIGGFITKLTAQKYHCPFELIDSGTEGILQAVQEAKRIAHARNLEKAKTELFQAVLNYSHEGIISIDNSYKITFFNPIAEKIAGTKNTSTVGKPISKICPELDLHGVMEENKDFIGQLTKINNIDVLCNKIPITVNGQSVGAVITIQDVTKIQNLEARLRNRIYASGHYANFTFQDIEKTSVDLKPTVEMAKQYALTPSSILITGETGCGKEAFAQSIHNYSSCNNGPFVAINCAALPPQILESELFGYERGAFTGANPKGKPGLFEVAHGGTLFLDEIAELDYLLQSKLLRVIQERKVQRLGSDYVIPINVRLISATNTNLKTLVHDNKFRADLYYRLNVLQLKIPPLRTRKKDIILLAETFLTEGANLINKHLRLTASAKKELLNYSWHGNVRELKNLIERIVAVHKDSTIDAMTIRQLAEEEPSQFEDQLLKSELQEIQKALAVTKGKRNEAAKILGMSRSTLWRKLAKIKQHETNK